MDAMVIDEPNASSSSEAVSSVPDSPALDLQTICVTSASPDPQLLTRERSSSFRRLSFSKVKSHATSAGVKFAVGVVGLPVISEMLGGVYDGVKAYENMDSNKNGLVKLEQKVKGFLNMLQSEPLLLNTDQEYAHFTQCTENLHVRVESELKAGRMRRLEIATKLDGFARELSDLVNNCVNAGHLQPRRAIVPEEFDSTIPSLKLVNEGNGLVIRELISIRRYDGTPVDETRVRLHVYTYQAKYNDVPVEVEEYCGGPDDCLVQTLTELVDNYNQRGINPVLQKLHGGSVLKDQAGRLRAYLVLSPPMCTQNACPINITHPHVGEGIPWVEFVKAKQSVELLCQVAEKTMIIFRQLKQNKQMNFVDIRFRSDDTLLLVPHTEGDMFLLEENVFHPSMVGRDSEHKSEWPFEELCKLLHVSSIQGLIPDVVIALRAYKGTWDNIAVWRVGRDIGLRPPPRKRVFNCYPPHQWNLDPGWIIHWSDSSLMLNEPGEHFNLVDRLPKSMIEEYYEQQHLGSFMIKYAMGRRGDESIDYFDERRGENWFLPAQQNDWECFPLEPWEGVEHIELHYESVRLELVEWDEWKHALKSAAQKKQLTEEDLGVVILNDVLMRISKWNVPELGTRPIYFYRRKKGADISPQQFWGFYTFNQDPLGPTGLTVRCSKPNQLGRIVSESLPPDPADYKQHSVEFEIETQYVDMYDDWSFMIKDQKEHNRPHKAAPRYREETLECSDCKMDVD